MTHEKTLELLDDFLDGELDPRDERAVRRHLMECDACREEERALRTLLAHAAALPGELLPERDLWAGIAPRLAPRAPATAPRTRQRPRHIPGWMLAAASVALVVGTSLLTLELAPRRGEVTVLPAEQAAPPAAAAGPPSALVAFRPAEQVYEQAIDELAAVLEARRDELAPQTVAVLEENLRIIDQAIADSRAALARDPSSAELTLLLAGAYDAKLGVLRRAVQL